MKKHLRLLLPLVMIVCGLCACTVRENPITNSQNVQVPTTQTTPQPTTLPATHPATQPTEDEIVSLLLGYDFVHCGYIDGCDDIELPLVIRSVSDLEILDNLTFYDAYTGIPDYRLKYGEFFFEYNTLIIIHIRSYDLSLTYSAKNFYRKADGNYVMTIYEKGPYYGDDVFTDDYLLFVEVSALITEDKTITYKLEPEKPPYDT